MNSNQNVSLEGLPRRSWVVTIKGHMPVLEHSRWVVGYTPAHKETPAEAIEFAIQTNIRTQAEIEAIRVKLLDLLAVVDTVGVDNA